MIKWKNYGACRHAVTTGYMPSYSVPIKNQFTLSQATTPLQSRQTAPGYRWIGEKITCSQGCLMDGDITATDWLPPVSFTKCHRMERIGKLFHPDTGTFSTEASIQMANSLLMMRIWNMISTPPGIAQPVFVMSPVGPCTVGGTGLASVPNSIRTHCPPW